MFMTINVKKNPILYKITMENITKLYTKIFYEKKNDVK